VAGGILLGTVFAATGIFLVVYDRRFQRRGVRTTGSVVDLERHPVSGPNGVDTYSPVLEFRTADGAQVRAVARVSDSVPPAVGKQVPVLYDPSNPSVAEIDTIMGRGTLFAGLFAAVGLAFIATTIIHG
jgi:hypothetical protein